jgi:hypothetical protein
MEPIRNDPSKSSNSKTNCGLTPPKQKGRASIGKLESERTLGSSCHSHAVGRNLNLAAHRAALSTFYPNVSGQDRKIRFKQELIVSSRPSILSNFYSSLKELDEINGTTEQRHESHVSNPQLRVVKEKIPDQIIHPSASIGVGGKLVLPLRANKGRGLAA